METLLDETKIELISDEQFDFDVPVSPFCHGKTETIVPEVVDDDNEDEEDEIFFGPVSHIEKCVSEAVTEQKQEDDSLRPLSPLTADQMVQLFKDAQTVAFHIESKHKPEPEVPSVLRDIVDTAATPRNRVRTPRRPPSGRFQLCLDEIESPVSQKNSPCVKPEVVPPKVVPTYNTSTDAAAPTIGSTNTTTTAPKIQRPGLRAPSQGLRPPSSQHALAPGVVPSKAALDRLASRNASGLRPNNTAMLKPPTSSKLAPPKSQIAKAKSPCNNSEKGLKVAALSRSKLKSPCLDGGVKNNVMKNSGVRTSRLKSPAPAKPASSLVRKPSLIKPAASRPGIASKLELMKPGGSKLAVPGAKSQLASIAGNSGIKKAPAPLKPLGSNIKTFAPPPKPMEPPKSTSKQPLKATVVFEETPIKPDKKVLRKRLIEDDPPSPPPATPTRKHSDCSIGLVTPGSVTRSAKRRSMLPTPSRLSSVASSASSRRSLSSCGSMDRGMSPRIGPLIDLNGVGEMTPSCMKARKPLVQHTPQHKENQVKRSIWSPVKRRKPITSAEDEYMMCTKHTAFK